MRKRFLVLLILAVAIPLLADVTINGGRVIVGNLSFGTDPADTGVIRLENNTSQCWEASPAGTDVCVKVDASEQLDLGSGPQVNAVLDAEGTGNTLTIPTVVHYLSGVCQGSAASLGFNLPATNAAAAACVTGTNTQRAVADFDASTDESMQGSFTLRDWNGADMNVEGVWFAAATTGNVDWNMEFACVADGETGDPTWDTDVLSIIDAAKGTANQHNDFSGSVSASTRLSSCAAGETLYRRLFRDADDAANDTMTGDARPVSLRFSMRRAM